MSESRFRRGANRVVLFVCVLIVPVSFPAIGQADDDLLVPPSTRLPTLSLNPVAGSTEPVSRTTRRSSTASDSTAAADAGMPLRRPSASAAPRPVAGLTPSIWKTAVILGAVCLGLFVVARLLGRRRGMFAGGLPGEVIEVLGRTQLDGHHSIQLVRCGPRVLVLSTDGSGALSTLAEISDPDEVNLLVDLCRPRRHRVDGGQAAESLYGGSTKTGPMVTESVHA